MAKNKKRSPYTPLITIGYVSFLLLVTGVLASTTVPMAAMLFDPQVLHRNVASLAAALTIGAIMPVLLGYIIGYYTIKAKTKAQRRFNGVAFGFLAYWIMTLSTSFIALPLDMLQDNPIARSVIINVIPSVLVVTMVALLYRRSSQPRQNVLAYKPFLLTIIGSIAVLHLQSIADSITTNNVTFYTLILPAATLILGGVACLSLKRTKQTTYEKIAWSTIAVSVAFSLTYTLSLVVHAFANYLPISPTVEAQTIVSSIGTLLALIVWIIYWRIQRKTLTT